MSLNNSNELLQSYIVESINEKANNKAQNENVHPRVAPNLLSNPPPSHNNLTTFFATQKHAQITKSVEIGPVTAEMQNEGEMLGQINDNENVQQQIQEKRNPDKEEKNYNHVKFSSWGNLLPFGILKVQPSSKSDQSQNEENQQQQNQSTHQSFQMLSNWKNLANYRTYLADAQENAKPWLQSISQTVINYAENISASTKGLLRFPQIVPSKCAACGWVQNTIEFSYGYKTLII